MKMKTIISSFPVFEKECPALPENNARTEALKKYFKNGGVISINEKKGTWPKLTYPSLARIRTQKKELEELKNIFEKKKKNWDQKKKEAQNYHQTQHMKKLTEPLYWKHFAKYITDKNYKKNTDTVKLPAHLAADPKWKPLIRTFLENEEYRNKLIETVENSIVYKGDQKLAKYADTLMTFRQEVTEKESKTLQKKIQKLKETINALNLMETWAKE
jgi:hypothetical protein